MARAMIHNKDVAKDLWGEAVNTTCHIVNWVYFKLGTKKTSYELWKGRKLKVKYFKIFGSTCFILKDKENVGKFDTQSYEGIFLGYSFTSKAYKVLNKRTRKVMKTVKCCDRWSFNFRVFKRCWSTAEVYPSILPLTLENDQEVGDQDPYSPASPSAMQISEDASTSLQPNDHLEKEPLSKIKLMIR